MSGCDYTTSKLLIASSTTAACSLSVEESQRSTELLLNQKPVEWIDNLYKCNLLFYPDERRLKVVWGKIIIFKQPMVNENTFEFSHI